MTSFSGEVRMLIDARRRTSGVEGIERCETEIVALPGA
jgi:hypothetical protein